MPEVLSPITWFGGKGNLITKLLPLIPPHKKYIEVFGGGATMLFAKELVENEVYNDIDQGLVECFWAIKDAKIFNPFFHFLNWTPYSREEYHHCLETWGQETDPAIKAAKWYAAARMSFSGVFGGGWRSVVTQVRRDMVSSCSRWLSAIENLPTVHQRLQNVDILFNSWEVLLDCYEDKEHIFMYLDPPYIPETRRGGEYQCEMTEEDHSKMVQSLLKHKKTMFMLSGYNHPVYKPLEDNGWERIDIETVCAAVGRTRSIGMQGEGSGKAQTRIESVWRNPACIKQWNKKMGMMDGIIKG